MIKNLKGHPHNMSEHDTAKINTIAKEQFMNGSEVIYDEDIETDPKLEGEIKIRIGAETKAIPA